MRFVASAPCKAILFGEHYVVYGAGALSLPIEPRNSVEFTSAKNTELRSELGSGTLSDDCGYAGPEKLLPFAAVAKRVFPKGGLPGFSAEFLPAWKIKGVGTSASLCAAFAAGLFRLKGKKTPQKEIFEAAQQGDQIAHNGRASGIDAKTVSFGKPMIFWRRFSPAVYQSLAIRFFLPEKSELLLVDTFAGKKDGTGKMLEKFAAGFGMIGLPQDSPEELRKNVVEEYDQLWHEIKSALKRPTARKIGDLMNENHSLLKKRGMSSRGIEGVIAAALAAGAYGAKLTGGGGEGGAVLVLCSRGSKLRRRIEESTGFSCHALSLASGGARAEAAFAKDY